MSDDNGNGNGNPPRPTRNRGARQLTTLELIKLVTDSGTVAGREGNDYGLVGHDLHSIVLLARLAALGLIPPLDPLPAPAQAEATGAEDDEIAKAGGDNEEPDA